MTRRKSNMKIREVTLFCKDIQDVFVNDKCPGPYVHVIYSIALIINYYYFSKVGQRSWSNMYIQICMQRSPHKVYGCEISRL